MMYYNGEGVAQNYIFAYAWLSLAAAQGHDGSKEERDSCASKLTKQALLDAQAFASHLQKEIESR